jgi:hypothetical protein
VHKVFNAQFSSIYPLYVAKVERKGRTRAELDQVICWLTGFTAQQLQDQIAIGSTLREFFDAAQIHDKASLITGKICGVRIEEIEDPLMRKIRYLDKLVDEIAQGRSMEKILRG